jgi:hypothetical protein
VRARTGPPAASTLARPAQTEAARQASDEPIDVVYTWVDDRFPGYLEQLQRFSQTRHDRNPNRTRDNLDLLKYSLRSLERHVPWFRRLYLVSCRPQVPAWLNQAAPGLHLVHHDQFIDQDHLPTFNSFAIVTNLHRLPGVSSRFMYVEDDVLFGREFRRSDLLWPDGSHKIWLKNEWSQPAEQRERRGASPWQLALAQSNHLLDRRYRPERRRSMRHGPYLLDRALWQAMLDCWPDDFQRTSASRFRAMYNVAPEQLYPYFLLYESKARTVSMLRSYREAHYQGVDNILPQQIAQFAFLHWLRPKFYCLNDNFGPRPSRTVVRLARRFLERHYPHPSRFELPANR